MEVYFGQLKPKESDCAFCINDPVLTSQQFIVQHCIKWVRESRGSWWYLTKETSAWVEVHSGQSHQNKKKQLMSSALCSRDTHIYSYTVDDYFCLETKRHPPWLVSTAAIMSLLHFAHSSMSDGNGSFKEVKLFSLSEHFPLSVRSECEKGSSALNPLSNESSCLLSDLKVSTMPSMKLQRDDARHWRRRLQNLSHWAKSLYLRGTPVILIVRCVLQRSKQLSCHC